MGRTDTKLNRSFEEYVTIDALQAELERRRRTLGMTTLGPSFEQQKLNRLRDGKRNLESITWYLLKLSERVEELGVKDAAEFRSAASKAEEAISSILRSLNGA